MSTKVAQPKVDTLIAELFVVRIGNKQMTQAVFKQLYNQSCWDKEYNIIYPIWGKVNRAGENFVIFQFGDELRKCRIPDLISSNDPRKDKLIFDLRNQRQLFIAV